MWHGIDLSLTARLEDVLLQGGVATGRRIIDYCGLQAQQPEILWGSFTELSGVAGRPRHHGPS